MKALLAVVTLAAIMLVAGCHTSGSIGVGDQTPKLQQPAQEVVVTAPANAG